MKVEAIVYSESRMVEMDHWVKMGTECTLEEGETLESGVEECRLRVNMLFKKIFPNSLQDPQFTRVNYGEKGNAASKEVASLLRDTPF